MNSTIFIDEPIIVPFTPGEVLVRLSQVIGALGSENLPQTESFQSAKTDLLQALEAGDHEALGSTLHAAQEKLWRFYENIQDNETQCALFGFPTPEFTADEYSIAPVNVQTVTATFTLTGKQILTSIAFERAANARFYWLHEVRHFSATPEERVEDPVIENSAPLFDRLRLPSGPRVLRIKSRNLSTSILSDEFTVNVPFL